MQKPKFQKSTQFITYHRINNQLMTHLQNFKQFAQLRQVGYCCFELKIGIDL